MKDNFLTIRLDRRERAKLDAMARRALLPVSVLARKYLLEMADSLQAAEGQAGGQPQERP